MYIDNNINILRIGYKKFNNIKKIITDVLEDIKNNNKKDYLNFID